MSSYSINDHDSADHDRLDEVFHQFQLVKPHSRTRALKYFEEFRSGLERHIVWEEEIVFPAFEQKTGNSGGPTEVMRWEHRQIRGYLSAIAEKLACGDDDTADDELGLVAVLCPHNHKEEGILYPMIDRVTGPDERKRLFSEMNNY